MNNWQEYTLKVAISTSGTCPQMCIRRRSDLFRKYMRYKRCIPYPKQIDTKDAESQDKSLYLTLQRCWDVSCRPTQGTSQLLLLSLKEPNVLTRRAPIAFPSQSFSNCWEYLKGNSQIAASAHHIIGLGAKVAHQANLAPQTYSATVRNKSNSEFQMQNALLLLPVIVSFTALYFFSYPTKSPATARQ